MKKSLNVSIDDFLVKIAKDEGLNISAFLEDKLAEAFRLERKWVPKK